MTGCVSSLYRHGCNIPCLWGSCSNIHTVLILNKLLPTYSLRSNLFPIYIPTESVLIFHATASFTMLCSSIHRNLLNPHSKSLMAVSPLDAAQNMPSFFKDDHKSRRDYLSNQPSMKSSLLLKGSDSVSDVHICEEHSRDLTKAGQWNRKLISHKQVQLPGTAWCMWIGLWKGDGVTLESRWWMFGSWFQGPAETGCRRRSMGNIVEEEEGCGLDLLMVKRMELIITHTHTYRVSLSKTNQSMRSSQGCQQQDYCGEAKI